MSALERDVACTVVLAGDGAGPQARWLAEQRGWPLLAEPTSGARSGSHALASYRLLLGDEDLIAEIERVVVCGHPTLSRPVSRLISRSDIEVLAVPGPLGMTDPGRVAREIEIADVTEPTDPTVTDWLTRWQRRDREVGARLAAFLDDAPYLLPHHVARGVALAVAPEIARAAPAGLLVVGASNPIRDLDLVAPVAAVGAEPRVLANRGLAGIDGTVSTAIGAAIGWASGETDPAARAFALLGDVTFLHDANGLLIGPGEVRPDLQIVVVNDNGGSIFAGLEQGAPAYAQSFDKLFATPHDTDIAALCRAHGVPHRAVSTVGELTAALAAPRGGIEVVEAQVRRDDRRELDARIRALVGPG